MTKLNVEKPVLSVLIPAYEYAAGVSRLLDLMGPYDENVEYLISDDSTTTEVEDIFNNLQVGNLRYVRNVPALGAVANWNSLLEAASGEFVMLVHHDEYAIQNNFFSKLAQILVDKRGQKTDVFMLELRLSRSGTPYSYKLAPDKIREFLFLRYPRFLLKRNFVGPTATLVMRRKILPTFDVSLRWLVDVDFYLKVIFVANKTEVLKNMPIFSEVGRTDSITATLGSNIPSISEAEAKELNTSHCNYLNNQHAFLENLFLDTLWFISKTFFTTRILKRVIEKSTSK